MLINICFYHRYSLIMHHWNMFTVISTIDRPYIMWVIAFDTRRVPDHTIRSFLFLVNFSCNPGSMYMSTVFTNVSKCWESNTKIQTWNWSSRKKYVKNTPTNCNENNIDKSLGLYKGNALTSLRWGEREN